MTSRPGPVRGPLRARLLAAALAALALLASRPAPAAWPRDPYNGNVPVSLAPGYREATRACSDGAGGMIIVWDETRDNGLSYDLYAQRISAYGEPMWPTNGIPLCNATGDQYSAEIVSDGSGGAIVAWQDVAAGTSDLYAQHVSGSGLRLWAARGVPVCLAANQQLSPCLAPDGGGGAVIAWRDRRNGPSDDVYAQRMDGSGTALWTADGVLLCGAAGSQTGVAIASDGAGGAIVAWQDGRNATYSAVYAQRVSGGAALWAANGVPVCSGSFSAYSPEIVAAPGNGAVLAWEDLRAGLSVNSLYAQRLDGSGVGQWTLNGVPMTSTTGAVYNVHIADDGQGGFLGAWEQVNAGTNYDVMAQRLDAGGARRWGASGLQAIGGPDDQSIADLLGDGLGGSYVVGYDYGSFYPDVFAQHVSPDGELLWDSHGVPIAAAAWGQTDPTLVLGAPGTVDGRAPLLLAWQDERSAQPNESHVYAQRVDAFGELGDAAPVITGVRDVTYDQGGRVRLSFLASVLDQPLVLQSIGYTIWRAVPSAAAAGLERARGETADPAEAIRTGRPWRNAATGTTYAWEYVQGLTAAGQAEYAVLVTSTGDSLPGSNPLTLYMVEFTDWDANPRRQWYSSPDSGYSADNLPPATPAPFSGTYAAGTARLSWHPNREADLAGYRIHRGTSPGFVPGPASQIAAKADTGFVDAAGTPYVYKVVAVDVHGNASPPATYVPADLVDVPPPHASGLALAAPAPNPVRGTSTVRFSLPQERAARLTVFDASGRRVRVLRDGVLAAGEHAVAFAPRDDAGRALPSGLYLIQLESGVDVRTRRVLVVR